MRQPFDRRSLLLAVGTSLALTLGFGTALAQEPGADGPPGTESPRTQSPGTQSPSVADIFIGELERRIIGDYYQRRLHEWEESEQGHNWKKGKKKNKHQGLPPGLAKKSQLPPGLAKQLARNGHLPPGLEYRWLPNDLLVQLPPLHRDYRYVITDNRVLLIQAASNLILDVMQVAAVELLD